MIAHQHQAIRCRACGTVVMSCRCPGPKREVWRDGPCDACTTSLRRDRLEDDIDMVTSTCLALARSVDLMTSDPVAAAALRNAARRVRAFADLDTPA